MEKKTISELAEEFNLSSIDTKDILAVDLTEEQILEIIDLAKKDLSQVSKVKDVLSVVEKIGEVALSLGLKALV